MVKNLLILPITIYILWFVSAAHSSIPSSLKDVNKWFIFLDYDEDSAPKNFFDSKKIKEFDMAILDPDHHPFLEPIKDDVILIAYVSIGEAEDYRFYWERISAQPWIIGENPNWKGNYYVDVRNKEWQRLIIEEVIPQIMVKGFQGLMLDTLDTAEMLEADFSEKYEGAKQAMADFVHDIHRAYPDLYLISNNGFSILEKIAPYLSGLLVEDIYWMVDFERESYKQVSQEERQYKLDIIKPIQEKYSLSIFNIDYIPAYDHELREKCLEASRHLNFKPYVSQKDLDQVYF